ncbi:MAG: ankyrin repeat domain-containing protein [Betaproteobacteria bacterium]|nr:ankyrin repeat domain-containing protein [Betaproteobacteria bacterium]
MSITNESLREVFAAYKLHPEFLGINIQDVNQRGALDGTLLHIAARTGNCRHIQILVGAGADLNVKGDLDNTPLHDAALCGQATAVDLLLSLGADTMRRNEFGQTALDIAIVGGKTAVCEVLRKRHGKNEMSASPYKGRR